MRPNIRVEIQNNLAEPMEVDENEEGEISDNDEKGAPEKHVVEFKASEKVNEGSKSTFTTGVDILDKKEQEKLEERARRFCLNPEEIKNFKDEDLQLLHCSLGINPSNESNVRFEVIHLRGIEQMNAGDILDYFLEYAPVSVEWIDEESCNVVWQDKLTATRALHFISKPVRDMPVRDDTSYFDNLQESEDDAQSILLVNKNREVQLQEEVEENPLNKLLDGKNSVDISEITTTIPPGYWRLGNKHPKAKSLLLRFAFKTDKQPFKTEQFSRYYKVQGRKNPNQTGIFARNKDLLRGPPEENPWTVLAKNWDEDAPFREKVRTPPPEETKLEIKNPSLKVRLGTKRKEDSENPEPEPPKKIKIPRMRMYADEEEEKIKRRQMLKRINTQIKKIEEDPSTNSDLRTVLNMSNRTHAVKLEKPEPEVFDLGSRLKNRNKKMVFEIKTEAAERKSRDVDEHHHHHHTKSSRERIRRDRVSRRRYSHSDDEEVDYRRGDKPKSKVAVVIKTQKRPTVASAVASSVWSRVSTRRTHNSESESDSDSDSESSSSSESEEEEEHVPRRTTSRPGFSTRKESLFKSPLKIEINNDHFKRK